MAAFTTIAAGVGVAASAGSIGMTFADAAKQRDLQSKAEQEGQKMMDEARRKVNVNPFAAISLPTEAYKLQSEGMLQQGAQLTEAAKESERGVAATAGRVQMAQQEGQQQMGAQMAKDLTSLDIAKAKEDANIRDRLASIDLAEAEGAQKAAADSAKAQAELKQAGIQGVADLAGKAAAAAPLFDKSAGAKQFSKFESEYGKMVSNNQVPSELMGATGKPLSSAEAYAKLAGFTPDQLKTMSGNKIVNREDAAGATYQTYAINPFEIQGATGFNKAQGKLVRKNLANPTFLESLPNYELGIMNYTGM